MYLVFSMNVIRRIRQIIYLHNIFSPCLTEADNDDIGRKIEYIAEKWYNLKLK